MGEVPRHAAGGVHPPGGVWGVGLRVRDAPVFLQGPPVKDCLRPQAFSGKALQAEVDYSCPLGGKLGERGIAAFQQGLLRKRVSSRARMPPC